MLENEFNEKSGHQIALITFKKIKQMFPSLKCEIHSDIPIKSVSMIIPKQKELDFNVWLNYHNNNLYLTVSFMLVGWNDCADPITVSAYIEIVKGLLCGRFRIVEFQSKGKPLKSKLQVPYNEDWKTINECSYYRIPFFKKMEILIICNNLFPSSLIPNESDFLNVIRMYEDDYYKPKFYDRKDDLLLIEISRREAVKVNYIINPYSIFGVIGCSLIFWAIIKLVSGENQFTSILFALAIIFYLVSFPIFLKIKEIELHETIKKIKNK